MVEKSCEFCGKLYEVKHEYGIGSAKKRKYCSRGCSLKGQKRNGNWREWVDRKVD